jgi:hypothetical protein
MTSPSGRQAGRSDLPQMADALARAFRDDPVMAWLFGDDEDVNERRLRRFFAIEGGRHLEHPTVFTTDDHAGAAYWDPPGPWASSSEPTPPTPSTTTSPCSARGRTGRAPVWGRR